ncbi:vitellogenin receptor-like isoform X2 [Planococcus citri]|uniref:vitellogenin receptor-like isoform X2 n=1 Tax=Planococcus citri TaxID=170843 RepID=UPI0031F94211
MCMCEKIPTRFWRLSVLMRIFAIFCLLVFCVVNAESVKNPPRFYLPGEENENVDGQNNEYSPMKQDCSVHNGQFLCKDTEKCIDLSEACDDECDCFDCSDESALCWEYNEILCQSCDHLCFPSPHGSVCLSSNNTRKSSPLLVDLRECGPDAVCDQKCVMYEGIERCSCRENYRAKPETKGRECMSDVSYENLLLYSTDSEIKLYNFTTNEAPVIREDVNCQGLAASGDYYYYGTAKNRTAHLHKTRWMTGETDLIIETCTDSSMVYSIDVDWITGNIYFSTDQCLGVCSEEEFCTIITPLSWFDTRHLGLAPRSGGNNI